MSLETTTEEKQMKIKPEQLDMLLKKASDTEMKYMLVLELEGRSGGCGYVYLYNDEIDVIYGKVELVTLESSTYDCEWKERLLVIPFEVPTVVVRRYRDDNPEISDFDEFYIFTAEGWKSVRVEVPK